MTTFCPDAVYWDGWISTSLLINLTNLSTIKQMFYGDTILTGFGCLIWSHSTIARGTADADVRGL